MLWGNRIVQMFSSYIKIMVIIWEASRRLNVRPYGLQFPGTGEDYIGSSQIRKDWYLRTKHVYIFIKRANVGHISNYKDKAQNILARFRQNKIVTEW